MIAFTLFWTLADCISRISRTASGCANRTWQFDGIPSKDMDWFASRSTLSTDTTRSAFATHTDILSLNLEI